MVCATCGHENSAGSAYCSSCGVMLGLECPNCHAANNPKARRCGACGAVLRVEASNAAPTTRAPRESRRIVTVLFADIVGFTTLVESYAERAEHVRDLLKEYFDALAAVVIDHGGTVEKFIGDAICALFGAPIVHEDDPQRALSAALEMQLTVARLNRARAERASKGKETSAPARELQLRIGISTGEVVGGTAEQAGETQYSVTGDAVNTAARLQSAALPDQTLVSAQTERLTRDRFVLEPAGEVKLKGKRQPVTTFLLKSERHEPVTAGSGRESGLVGRRHELAHLTFCLNLAAENAAQLVEVIGDPGVGKSRLIEAFVDQLDPMIPVYRGSCPTLAGSPLYPFQGIAAGLLSNISGNGELSTLNGAVDVLQQVAAGTNLAEAEYSLELVADALLMGADETSSSGPAVLIVENVHRADPDTLDLLRWTISKTQEGRVLIIWTRRSGEEMIVEGDTQASLTRMLLRPLNELEAAELMEELLGSARLPRNIADLIVSRSGGNPLYIEAMVRSLLEDETMLLNAEKLDTIQVPATVQGLIQSRMDSLPEAERLLLQEAAVVGREFDAALLKRVDLFGLDVTRSLDSLVLRGLLERAAEDVFRFRHVLTQEVAYDTMLEALRTELHREVAEALCDQNPDGQIELAPVIADHYAKAGDTERAVEVLVQAGTGA